MSILLTRTSNLAASALLFRKREIQLRVLIESALTPIFSHSLQKHEINYAEQEVHTNSLYKSLQSLAHDIWQRLIAITKAKVRHCLRQVANALAQRFDAFDGPGHHLKLLNNTIRGRLPYQTLT